MAGQREETTEEENHKYDMFGSVKAHGKKVMFLHVLREALCKQTKYQTLAADSRVRAKTTSNSPDAELAGRK